MRELTATDLLRLASAAGLPRHLTSSLRPASVLGWELADMVGLFASGRREGLLVYEHEEEYFPMAFRFGRAISITGRQRSILCDLCITQHEQGGLMTVPVLTKDGSPTGRRIGRYCCGDLLCSQHAYGITEEGRSSRQAFPETITVSRKIQRLESNVMRLLDAAEVRPINL